MTETLSQRHHINTRTHVGRDGDAHTPAPDRFRADGSLPRPTLASLLRLTLDYPQLGTAILGGILLAVGTAIYLTQGPDTVRMVILAGAYLLCGWRIALESLHALRHARLDIDVLMFTAALGAAALGHYEEGALLLLLFSLGESGEQLAIGRARRAISNLTQLAPRTACRIASNHTPDLGADPTIDPDTANGNHDQIVPVESLKPGDLIRIGADEQVPADAVVARGYSSVDQSPITGESIPVDKHVGDELFAGTFNTAGTLIARVTRSTADNTLSKLIRLVEQAQHAKSPTQQFTERFARWYVPCVLGATVLLMLVPPLLGIAPRRHDGALWAGWFYQALAFLTAASPCALAIGTPAAILAGIGKAARIGVLVKGGVHLENLAAVHTVAFDKTGTLTTGKPALVQFHRFDNAYDENQILAWVGSIERASHHPIARAIVHSCQARNLDLPEPSDVERLLGHGIRGRIDGHAITIGKRELFDHEIPPAVQVMWDDWQQHDRTTIGIAIDDQLIALMAFLDQPRPDAALTIQTLHQMGMRQTVMLTGDHATTAHAIAKSLGITRVEAELLPEQKLDRIRELDARAGGVAMVGDGVNDAPALAAATVGIAVGGAGTANDVALETADIVLMANRLAQLPHAIALARFTRRIIRQNLIIAFGVIALLAPVAALGFAPISIAVLFHEGSTILVVLNGLRILGHQSPHPPGDVTHQTLPQS